jgi:hypothetical protein
MEHIWSRAVATGGNQSQMRRRRQRPRYAKTVAVGCNRLPIGAHGKEGVDGSSPSEGFSKVPANRHFVVVCVLNTRTHSGHICGTRDVLRRFATSADTVLANGSDELTQQTPFQGGDRLLADSSNGRRL